MSLKDGIFWALAPFSKHAAVILMYHSVAELPAHYNSVPLLSFEQQMKYLKDEDFTVVPLSQLVESIKNGVDREKTIAITFDDGFKNNYVSAFPILRQYGFPATIFVTTGYIGSTNEKYALPYLTEAELDALEASGLISIEPHTVSHPRLTKIGKDEAQKEILDSKTTIEKLLKKTCAFFAYPYGACDRAIAEIVEGSGFEAAVGVQEGTLATREDLFRLPRVSIDATTSMIQFKGKLTSAVDTYESFKKIWRR